MLGYSYILECADGSYYVGSTKYPEARLAQHQAGEGANWTAKRLPVQLVYLEEAAHIGLAFQREHQLKKWSRKKKHALIEGRIGDLATHAKCQTNVRALIARTKTWSYYAAKLKHELRSEQQENPGS